MLEESIITLSSAEAIVVESISQPAILPPLNNTCEPVIWPLDFNIKLSFEELIWVESNSNPPILPPVNNTCEPVILPPAETLNLLDDINDAGSFWSLEDDILQYGEYVNDALSIFAPPILPADAVIVPSNIAPLAWRTPSELTAKLGPNLTK